MLADAVLRNQTGAYIQLPGYDSMSCGMLQELVA